MSECNPTSEEIACLVDALDTASEIMTLQAQYEDVVIFLGTTKSGKSTLINFLLGNELVGERLQPFLPVSIRKINSDCGPAIGVGSISETIIPTRWDNVRLLPDLVLWDAPGFEDNRGSIQDIINAYYIYELFQRVQSIRIVLVVDFTDIINDRVNPFLRLLGAVEKTLRSMMTDYFPSIVVTFSKVPHVWLNNVVDIKFICQMLEHKILHNSKIDISPVCWNFVHYLIENYYQIGLFLTATVGKIGNDIDWGVSSSILNAKSISCDFLKEVLCPSLADKSQSFLYNVRRSLLPMKSFHELLSVVQDVFGDELKVYTVVQEDEEANDILQVVHGQLNIFLNQIKEVLNCNINFQQKIDLLQTLDHRIERKIVADGLLEKSKLIQFVDRLLDLKESKEFDIYIDGALMKAQSETEKLVLSVKIKVGEIMKSEYDRKMEEMRNKYEKEIETLQSQLNKK